MYSCYLKDRERARGELRDKKEIAQENKGVDKKLPQEEKRAQ